MGERGPEPTVTTAETRAIFESGQAGEPYTSSEVAERLGCARTTAYKKLQALAESGDLQTKKVGARGRVWWRGPEAEHGPETPESGRDAENAASEADTFRAVFEGAFDAMLLADDDARYVDANPAACDLFGLSRDELLGRSIEEFAAEGYDFEAAWREFQESERDRGIFPLARADGEERIVEFGATPNVLPGRHLSVLRDVTEYREVKAELRDERDRARQYQQTLHANEVIELEFQTNADSDFFVALSDRFDCRCVLEGLVTTRDGTLLHYVQVDGPSPAEVLALAETTPQVDDCRVVHESEVGTLFELDVRTSAVRTLIEAGASGRTMVADRGTATVVVEAAPDADIRQLIDAFLDRYEDSAFVAKRRLNRPFMTTRQYHESLDDSLTERQVETLRAAHLAGYYEWPRRSTAADVAGSMDVAASTWLRHLRKAEGTLVRSFFEELAV